MRMETLKVAQKFRDVDLKFKTIHNRQIMMIISIKIQKKKERRELLS